MLNRPNPCRSLDPTNRRRGNNKTHIDIDRMQAKVIRRWIEHPEEMTVAQHAALQEYLSRTPRVAELLGLPPLPKAE